MFINTDRVVLMSMLVFLMTSINTVVGGSDDPPMTISKFVPDWKINPSAPPGWKKIDEKRARITGGKADDVFMIITDGKNDMIVCFQNVEKYWNMTILASIPTKNHIEYGVKTEDLGLDIKEESVYYGIDGTEAIAFFRWSKKESMFISYQFE